MQQPVDQVPLVMVIDDADNPDHLPFGTMLHMRRLMADHGAQGVRARGIGALANLIIHEVEDFLFHRNAEASESARDSIHGGDSTYLETSRTSRTLPRSSSASALLSMKCRPGSRTPWRA